MGTPPLVEKDSNQTNQSLARCLGEEWRNGTDANSGIWAVLGAVLARVSPGLHWAVVEA